ncbi:hypothetical protein [Mesorhizobium sp. A623]
MADFVAVLRKTIDGMGATTPATRSRVYDKARSTIAAKLAAIDPPPAASVAERQKRALEDAIATVEQTYAVPAPAPASDPLAELENIFSSIDRNRNQPSHSSPTARTEPAPAPQVQAAPVGGAQYGQAVRKDAPAAETARGSADRRSGPDAPVAADNLPSYSSAEPETDIPEDSRSFGPKRGRSGLIAAGVALLVIAAGGYGIWLNADAFKGMFGAGKTETVKLEPLAPAAPASNTPAPTPAPAETSEPPKFTQRLNADGKETDPGPAGGESSIGEGTSVVALTTPPPEVAPNTPTAPAGSAGTPAAAPASNPAPPAIEAPLAVGQKAIFYEERTNVAQGSAEPGSIVWSLVQESPGGDAPPEPAIRAEATIPGKDVQLRMTIRRNTDASLPASHIIELIFLTPDSFEGGGIDNILRVAMKTSEQDAGSPLIGIPAKIADGFFLVALNDTKADEATNLALLRNQDWIDVPVIYKSGRRALLTMEKGIPGDKVFDEALKAWAAKTAG